MPFDDLNPADNTALLTKIWLNTLTQQISELAKTKGVIPGALDAVIERAKKTFVFSASGELRGRDGITPHGWLGFVLPSEAPHLFGKDEDDNGKVAPPTTGVPGHRISARERLDQANGAPGVRF